ncbi:MAG: hypothetical protein KUG77_27950 [Nannocystaceae bacterium]|nr:hypothetical protein [Nannocystaceae bacterium]
MFRRVDDPDRPRRARPKIQRRLPGVAGDSIDTRQGAGGVPRDGLCLLYTSDAADD